MRYTRHYEILIQTIYCAKLWKTSGIYAARCNSDGRIRFYSR